MLVRMGIDNMLAVGAASHGNLFLLLFGLILSIPMVVFMSTWLSKLMDRYPIILWIGAALLGKVDAAGLPCTQITCQMPVMARFSTGQADELKL